MTTMTMRRKCRLDQRHVLVSVQEDELEGTSLASSLEREGFFLRAIYNTDYLSEYDSVAWVKLNGNFYYNYMTETYTCLNAVTSLMTACSKAKAGKWIAICSDNLPSA